MQASKAKMAPTGHALGRTTRNDATHLFVHGAEADLDRPVHPGEKGEGGLLKLVLLSTPAAGTRQPI